MRAYVIYRELGHRSMFGEESITDLTPQQSKLLSLSHLYDVVQSSIGVHDSYGEGKTEIPDNVKPFPGKLLKWYETWQEQTKKQTSGATSSKSRTGGKKAKTILNDEETNAQAFAAYIKGRMEAAQFK